MKDIKDFITLLYAKHNYLGGCNDSKKGQIFDDGITDFIWNTYKKKILFHDDNIPIKTPVIFANYAKNKNKQLFIDGYNLAADEYDEFKEMNKKEFIELVNENMGVFTI